MNYELPNVLQTSLTGGEFTPRLHGRVDYQPYYSGAKTLKNVLVRAEGGADNRPGLNYNSAQPGLSGRIFPFQFNVEQNYALVHQDEYFTVFKDGGVVLKPGAFDYGLRWSHLRYDLVNLALFTWHQSTTDADNYYLKYNGGATATALGGALTSASDVRLFIPNASSVPLIYDAAGGLGISSWRWADEDTLGYSTLYVHLTDDVSPTAAAAGGQVSLYCGNTWYAESYRHKHEGHTVGAAQMQSVYRDPMFTALGGPPSAIVASDGDTNLITNSRYDWTNSPAQTESYYLTCEDTDAGEPDFTLSATDVVKWGDITLTYSAVATTVNSSDNYWTFLDADTLGFSTLYVHLAGDLDPLDNDTDGNVKVYWDENMVYVDHASAPTMPEAKVLARGGWTYGDPMELGFNTIVMRPPLEQDPMQYSYGFFQTPEYGSMGENVDDDDDMHWTQVEDQAAGVLRLDKNNEGETVTRYLLDDLFSDDLTMTEGASIAEVAATKGTWYYDSAANAVYVQMPDVTIDAVVYAGLTPFQFLRGDPVTYDAYLVYWHCKVKSNFTLADLPTVRYCQSNDVLFMACPGKDPVELARYDHYAWDMDKINFGSNVPVPNEPYVSNAGTLGTWNYKYKVTAVNSNGGESLPSNAGSVTNGEAPHSWTAGESNYLKVRVKLLDNDYDIDYYKIYKNTRGTYGYVGTLDHDNNDASGTETWKDTNVDPDTSDGLPEERDPFSGSGNEPGALTLHQQRLFFARTDNAPNTFRASNTGDYDNFNVHRPLLDTDAINATLASNQLNEIKHLISLKDLIILTSGGWWSLSDGTGGSGLSPISMDLKSEGGQVGVSDVEPLAINSALLLVGRDGKTIVDLSYDLATDGRRGRNVSIRSSHLFEGRQVRSWTFHSRPYGVLWVVMDDGTLLSLTYEKDQEVAAWTRHESSSTVGGVEYPAEFIDAQALQSVDGTDEVYFLVLRTLSDGTGGTKEVLYVETLADREEEDLDEAIFLDSSITYRGVASDSISGLDHLEGCAVYAVADGVVQNTYQGSPLVVASGSITLDVPAEIIHVGLPYKSKIETLPVEMQLQSTSQGRGKAVKAVAIKVDRSRGFKVGPDGDLLTTPPEWEKLDATELYTGVVEHRIKSEWKKEGSVCIVQDQPLPMSILSISSFVEVDA